MAINRKSVPSSCRLRLGRTRPSGSFLQIIVKRYGNVDHVTFVRPSSGNLRLRLKDVLDHLDEAYDVPSVFLAQPSTLSCIFFFF